MTKDVAKTDNFTLNNELSCAQKRIIINSIQAQETKQEIEKTTERVFEDRQWQVDAAIVRIMKGKKKCTLKALTAALFEILRFPFETADLKKRVESLIERDYMAREAGDAQTFVYLA